MNNFTFNQHHYLQIHGTAMSNKMAPSFDNLFLGIFETNALSNAPFHPHIWWRYIDDIFMILTGGLDHLKIFVDYLNNILPTIKFTSNHSLTNVPFLDVMASLHNGTTETDLYTKPTIQTNTNTYLVQHVILNILKTEAITFSLALRIRRICSTDVKFTLCLNELRTYLLARGYGNTFRNSQFKSAANISRTEALHTNRHDSIDRLPFVVTFNPSLPIICNILRKYCHLLLSSKCCRDVLKQPPIVTYRRTSNLSSSRAKLQIRDLKHRVLRIIRRTANRSPRLDVCRLMLQEFSTLATRLSFSFKTKDSWVLLSRRLTAKAI